MKTKEIKPKSFRLNREIMLCALQIVRDDESLKPLFHYYKSYNEIWKCLKTLEKEGYLTMNDKVLLSDKGKKYLEDNVEPNND